MLVSYSYESNLGNNVHSYDIILNTMHLAYEISRKREERIDFLNAMPSVTTLNKNVCQIHLASTAKNTSTAIVTRVRDSGNGIVV